MACTSEVVSLSVGMMIAWLKCSLICSNEDRKLYSSASAMAIFFSPMPLLLAYGTMGIEMAIAPLWVERQLEDDSVIKRKGVLYTKVKSAKVLHPSIWDGQKQLVTCLQQ